MKKYILVLMLLAFNTSAEQSSKTIGHISNYMGGSLSVMLLSYNNSKSIFLNVRGKHGIRKASVILSKDEIAKLQKILMEASRELD